MFGWISRLFGRSRPAIFAERDRLIFRFWDGTRQRAADPLDVRAALDEHGGPNWPDLLGVFGLAATEGMPMSPAVQASHAANVNASVGDLVALTRQAFGVEPFREREDGTTTGMTQAETLDLLTSYLTFAQQLEESARPFRSGPNSTGVRPSPEESTTPPSPACGSSATGAGGGETTP